MKIKQAERLIPRTDVRTRRRAATRMLVRHVVRFYGTDDPLKWPTDMLKDLARTLYKLTPRDGW